MECKCAVVIAGAVAQGAWEAGALAELAARPIDICHVVGTSAGALNGLFLCHGIRAGRRQAATEDLCELWQNQASLWKLATSSLSLRGLLNRRAVFDQTLFYRLMREYAPALEGGTPITFRVAVSLVAGRPLDIDGITHRTHSLTQTFVGEDFEANRIERMYKFVAASAAFPILFTPVDLPGVGLAVDGGSTNNTPLSKLPPEVSRVYLIAATPANESTAPVKGFKYIERIVSALIQERLVRDLQRVDQRGVDIVHIRPTTELSGNAFSGLFSRRQRAAYVLEGRRRAKEILDSAS